MALDDVASDDVALDDVAFDDVVPMTWHSGGVAQVTWQSVDTRRRSGANTETMKQRKREEYYVWTVTKL